MKRTSFTALTSTLLIFLFSYTAFSKLTNRDLFQGTLAQMPLIETGAAILVWAIPLAELCIVLLLIFPFSQRTGFLASLVLLSLFTLFLIYMVVFVPHLPCSCGGIISGLGWKQHILMNAALLLLTYLTTPKRIAHTPLSAGPC